MSLLNRLGQSSLAKGLTAPHSFLSDRVSLAARALLCVAAVALSAFLHGYGPLRLLDERIQDFYTAHGPRQPAVPGVVILDISESSLAALGPWPWPRATLAQVSESLRARGARLQVWDLMLPEPATGDEALAAALSHGDVVLGQVLVTDPLVAHPPQEGVLLAAEEPVAGLCSTAPGVKGYLGVAGSLKAKAAGHVGATPDADGRLRHLPAVLCHNGQAYPQLALAAAQVAVPGVAWRLEQGTWPWQAPQTLVRGPWKFPLDEKGWLRVPYARAHHDWPAVNIEQVLDAARPLPELQGSIVLIGSTALGLADIVNTPFHPVAPGVSVHAELVAAAMAAMPSAAVGHPPSPSSAWLTEPKGSVLASALTTLVLGLLLVIRLWPQASLRGSVVVSGGVLVLPFLLAPLAREAGLLLAVLPATLALGLQAGASWLFNAAWLQRQSRVLARHLQGFMPSALARQIAARNPTGESLGHAESGTVMAIRIDGLQRWQGSMQPLRALGVIHALHAAAQSASSALGGRLEQAQGHLLMVAWPDARANGPALALAAARRCLQELQPLLARNESESHPLSMNIAIESGSYLHGIVGHAESRSALLLGPAVTDVQAMLELSNELACPVMMGPVAASRLSGGQTEVQRMGRFVLPSQAEPKDLFRLQTLNGLNSSAAQG